LEYEEVYKDRYYGTLREQVDQQLERGENVVCDVDVLGGINIKRHYGNQALSVFIQPPSIDALRQRLEGRGTDAPEVINDRIARAEFELAHASEFDVVVVNDVLENALQEAYKVVSDFLK
jgi:guanylate kinase